MHPRIRYLFALVVAPAMFLLAAHPCLAQAFTMLADMPPGFSHYRSELGEYMLYQITPTHKGSSACRMIIEVPVHSRQGAFLEFGFPNRSMYKTPMDRKELIALFGSPTLCQSLATFDFETLFTPTREPCKIDVVFKNDSIQKYRVKGPYIQRPLWRLASSPSPVPLGWTETDKEPGGARYPRGSGNYYAPPLGAKHDTQLIPESMPVPENK